MSARYTDLLRRGISPVALIFAVVAAPLAAQGKAWTSRPIAVEGSCAAEGGGKTCKVTFFLQPYKGAVLSMGSGPLVPKFAKADKTLAEATVVVKGLAADTAQSVITIQNPKTGSIREVVVAWVEAPPKTPPLIVLDAPQQRHRFLRRVMTGKQPKSAMFISPTQVVLPLLDDNHSEVIDILTGEVKRLLLPANYAKKGGFVESVRVPPLKEFWVSQMMASAIHRFDSATLAYKGSIDLTGSWTKVLAYDSVRNVVYASNWNSSDISVVSVAELKEIKRIKMNGVPRGMAFSTDGNFMLAAIFGGKSDSDGAGRTVKIDLEKQKVVGTVIEGGSHRHAVRLKNGDHFAVSDMARSKVYFISDYKKSSEINVYKNPNTIAESPDGKFLYVSCRGRNNPKSYLIKGHDMGHLMVVDLATQTVVEDIEAGNQPTGLDVSPDGKYIVLTDFLDHAMRVYERME